MQKINPGHSSKSVKRILVAPLDWGLGHTTRCIPIIKELEKQGCAIWLAGNEMQKDFLKKEFPLLPFLQLPGYEVKYAKTRTGLILKLVAQLPSISKMIQKENKWLKQKIKEHELDAVISDNRFGLFTDTIPCIFITHQLNIKSPLGRWSEKIIQRWNYHFINRFKECWVPDYEGEINLAGELSHPQTMPSIPIKYIGPVSRFEKKQAEIKNDLLIILSGPEPQRSMLEEKIIHQLKGINRQAVLVRGLPEVTKAMEVSGSVTVFNHLPSAELNEWIEKSAWVIGRCGYSTVMDLMKLKKKCILIPTPGQTEQEYLAKHLRNKKFAFTVSQQNFDLKAALDEASSFSFEFPEEDETLFKNTVQQFLRTLT